MDTTPTKCSPIAVLKLDQSLRRWPNIEPTLDECKMLEGKPSFQYMRGVSCFEILAVIQSVSLQTQHTTKSFELEPETRTWIKSLLY